MIIPIHVSTVSNCGNCTELLRYIGLASFPGSRAWAEKKEPGTHCLRMLSSPRISGYLEISVKYALLH